MSNVFSFTGTIGRDAEVRSTPNGQSVLNVTVANNTGFGDRQKTLWIRVALWGKRAEGSFPSYLKKGQQVFVSGELSQSEYQQDGTTRTSLELNASVLDLVGGKRVDQNAPMQQQQQQQQQNYQQPQQAAAQPTQQTSQQGFGANDSYDDVPF